MSVIDLRELIVGLRNALSLDKETRSSGEAYLEAASSAAGFLTGLVALCGTSSAEVEPSVRQFALIYLKNEITKFWRYDSGRSSCIVDREKTRVAILDLSCRICPSSRVERRLIDKCMYEILLRDYPEHWQDLPAHVKTLCANRGDILSFIGGLNVLVKIGRIYELSDRQAARRGMGCLLPECCPLIFELINSSSTADSLFATRESAYILKQFCKLFYLVNYSMRTEKYFVESDKDWWTLLALVIKAPIAAGQDELLRSFSMKAKRWACASVRSGMRRHCTIRRSKNDDPSSPELAVTQAFQTQHAPVFIEIFLQILQQIIVHSEQPGSASPDLSTTAGQRGLILANIDDKHLCTILDTFAQLIEQSGGYKFLKPHINSILVKICHPLLCYSDQDVEDHNLDQADYARNHATGLMMRGTDRSLSESVGAFVETVMRLRSKDFLAYLTTFIQHEFEQYKAAAANPNVNIESFSRRKYGAMLMLAEVAARLTCKKRNLEVVIEDLLYTHVAPELRSSNPWLRSAAATVMAAMFLHWEIGVKNSANLVEVVCQTLRNCGDADCIVRLESLRALATFVTFEDESVKKFIAQNVKEVCALLIGMADDLDVSESAAHALTDLCESFPDEILSVAPNLVKQLVSTFVNIVTKSDDAENQEVTAETLETSLTSVVQTICAICCVLARDKRAAEHMTIVAPVLEPFLDHGIRGSGEYYVEEALMCLALVTYDIPVIPAAYWKYYDAMYQAVCGGAQPNAPPRYAEDGAWGVSELPAFLGAIDNFLVRGKEVFASGISPYTGLPYKDEYFSLIRTGFKTADSDVDNPQASLVLVWLLADSCCLTLTDELLNLILTLCNEGINAIGATNLPKLAQQQLIKIYGTLIIGASSGGVGLSADIISPNTLTPHAVASVDRVLAALASQPQFNLSVWLKALTDNRLLSLVETKRVVIGAVTVLLERLCLGQESYDLVKQHGEDLVRVLAKQAVSITDKREVNRALEDAANSWDSNSEQDLDEDQDARSTILSPEDLDKLRNAGILNEHDDDDGSSADSDYHDPRLTDFGERISPLDPFCEYTSIGSSMKRHPEIFSKVIGANECVKLLEHVQKNAAEAAEAAAA